MEYTLRVYLHIGFLLFPLVWVRRDVPVINHAVYATATIEVTSGTQLLRLNAV